MALFSSVLFIVEKSKVIQNSIASAFANQFSFWSYYVSTACNYVWWILVNLSVIFKRMVKKVRYYAKLSIWVWYFEAGAATCSGSNLWGFTLVFLQCFFLHYKLLDKIKLVWTCFFSICTWAADCVLRIFSSLLNPVFAGRCAACAEISQKGLCQRERQRVGACVFHSKSPSLTQRGGGFCRLRFDTATYRDSIKS